MITLKCKKCRREFSVQPSMKDRRKHRSMKCCREIHGGAGTKLYHVWHNMLQRCHAKASSSYSDYGGRGISVCKEWRESFAAFRFWAISNGYKEGLEIDRRDTFGNYEPGNCRLVTHQQQSQNRRKRCDGKSSKYKGVDFDRRYGTWRAVASGRYIGSFKTELEAARAYDARALELFGEFAHLNFPPTK